MGISLAQWDRLSLTERDLRLAKHAREQAVCSDCGNPIEQCSDPTRFWFPYRRICYAAREREAAEAAYEAQHKERKWHDGTYTKWAEERSAAFPYRYDMAVKVGVADRNIAPWDDFTTRESASPHPPDDFEEASDGSAP